MRRLILRKKHRHTMSLLVVFILCISMSMSATAASVNWSDANGQWTAVAQVTKNHYVLLEVGQENSNGPIEITATNRSAELNFTGYIDATLKAEYTGIMTYKQYVTKAMAAEGAKDSVKLVAKSSEMAPEDCHVTVPNGVPAGKYDIALAYHTKDGTWLVSEGIFIASETGERSSRGLSGAGSGKFMDAPVGDWYITYCQTTK